MRALDGVRVLDLTHVLAGPFCTYQLALLGADVVKVEEPHHGDYMRRRGADEARRDALMGDHFVCQNGAKRSIALDIRAEAGRQVVRRLAREADVVVENFRTGVLERHGLGADALIADNPMLIHCSITAYGGTGPLARHPAYDNVVQAISGLMAATGTEDTGPLKAGAPVLDYASGTMAAFAITAALFRREQSGRGQRIDVSMLDVALLLQSPALSSLLNAGRVPKPHGNDHALAAASCYAAADGAPIMLGACNQREFERLCGLIDRPDLPADPRFAEVRRQDPHRAELAADLALTMATRTAGDWEAHLAAEVPAARVRHLDETLALEQIEHRGVIARAGRDRVPAAAFMCDVDGPHLDAPAPALGQHSREILAEAGYEPDEIVALLSSGVVAEAKEGT